MALVLGLLALSGCEQEVIETPTVQGAMPVYTGPAYLRGSIGSLAKVQGFEPLLISSFGLVVNLDDTGSVGVPAYLRQRMINYARLMGLGSANLDTQNLSPENVLADPRTAIVKVSGLVPPGATPGQRFDLLVEALPQTETTSLAGGMLWTTDMGIEGANASVPFTRTLAKGRGAIYTDPFLPAGTDASKDELSLKRKAIVVGGGTVGEPRRLRLVLNQPSWFRSGAIANRINERFPAPPNEKIKTANAKTDVFIDLSVPPRFRRSPREFLELVGSLYLQGGEGFEVRQTQRLANALRKNPEAAQDVALAWKAMGRVALPELRKLYNDPNERLRLTALDAGAWLGDGKVTDYIEPLAISADPVMRAEAATILAQLPQDRDAERILASLLDDTSMAVRLQAYNSLAGTDSQIIERFDIRDAFGVKFIIDRIVTAQRPLIYITQDRVPRIVIFGPELAFPDPTLARLWDNRLMMRYPVDGNAMKVFYQGAGFDATQIHNIQPSVETLAYLLGHKPSARDPQAGLGLSYGQVVDVIYQLQKQGFIVAPLEVRPNALSRVIDKRQETKTVERRAEFGGMEGLPEDHSAYPIPENELPAIERDGLPEPIEQPDFEPEGRREF